MDNNYTPAAKRTRLGQAEIYRKMHETVKRKKAERRSHYYTSGLASVDETGGVQGRNFCGSSDKAKGRDFQGISPVNPIVLDADIDDDIIYLGERDVSDNMQGKEFVFINDDDDDDDVDVDVDDDDSDVDDDSDSDDDSDYRISLGGGEVGKPVVGKSDNGSQCNRKRSRGIVDEREISGVAGRTRSKIRSRERKENLNGGDDDVYNISEDDLEELEGSSGDESIEDSDEAVNDDDDMDTDDENVEGDPDFEEYLVEYFRIPSVAGESSKKKMVDDSKKVDSVDGNRELNCGAKCTRSHFNSDSSKRRMELGTNSPALRIDEQEIEDDTDEDGDDEPSIEPTLPLKFRFGIEESIPPEKSEEEKELDRLWAKMELALYGNGVPDNSKLENEADLSPEVEPTIATLCRRGKHEFILDEEIGVLCKHCSYVDVEIRYVVPPFL